VSLQQNTCYCLTHDKWLCAISGFRRGVNAICALLGCYAALCGGSVPTFRDNLSVPSSTKKLGLTGCTETAVPNYHSLLRKISQGRRSQGESVFVLPPCPPVTGLATRCLHWKRRAHALMYTVHNVLCLLTHHIQMTHVYVKSGHFFLRTNELSGGDQSVAQHAGSGYAQAYVVRLLNAGWFIVSDSLHLLTGRTEA
jgi:hypothetical protein